MELAFRHRGRSATIQVMAVPERVQVPLSPEDRAALDAVMAAFPTLDAAGAAPLCKTLIRFGLWVYLQNPLTALSKVPTPTPEEMTAAITKALGREPGPRVTAPKVSDALEQSRGPSALSPATGTKVVGGMTTGTFAASGGPTSPPPEPPAAKPKSQRDPSKGKGRRDDPMREPTQDELDENSRRARR